MSYLIYLKSNRQRKIVPSYPTQDKVTNRKELVINEKRLALMRVFWLSIFFKLSKSQINRCFGEANTFANLGLKVKLIICESNFVRSVCGMVVYEVLKSKNEIDLILFLTLIECDLEGTFVVRLESNVFYNHFMISHQNLMQNSKIVVRHFKNQIQQCYDVIF